MRPEETFQEPANDSDKFLPSISIDCVIFGFHDAQIKVLLINHGPEPFGIAVGDRIAQLVVSSVVRVAVEESTEASETARGTGGFGHTGR